MQVNYKYQNYMYKLHINTEITDFILIRTIVVQILPYVQPSSWFLRSKLYQNCNLYRFQWLWLCNDGQWSLQIEETLLKEY